MSYQKASVDGSCGISEKVSNLGCRIVDGVDSGISAVGEKMEQFGGAIKENGPHDGKLGRVTNQVGEGIENSGEYLANRGLSDIGKDITTAVKRYPVQSIWIGMGLGLLVGSFFLSSKKR